MVVCVKFTYVMFFWNGNRSGYFDAVGVVGWGRGKGRGWWCV